MVYTCTSTGVRAVSCGWIAFPGADMCEACSTVSCEQGFQRRMARAFNRFQLGPSHKMRQDYMCDSPVARFAMRIASIRTRGDAATIKRAFDAVKFHKKSLKELHQGLQSDLHFQDYPAFVSNLVRAHDKGYLCRENKPFIYDILTGISTALVHGGTRNRKLSTNEKAFYKLLLMYGGTMVHNFVSMNLLGACISTSRSQLRSQPLLAFNTLSQNIAAVVDILKKYKLQGVPCLIGEDGTSLVKHLDPTMEQSADGDEDVLVVYGMDGGPVVVTSIDDVVARFNSHGFASTLYVWDLIPLVDKAPHIPIKIAINANKFTYVDVLTSWKELWRVCSDFGINVVGHVSDGDPKLRAADFVLQQNLQRTSGAEEYVEVDHPLIQLGVPVIHHSGTGSRHPMCCLQDFLHVMWRLRVMYLKPNRFLLFGPCLASPDNLRRHMKAHTTNLGLQFSDLNERDKQNFGGCLRLFGFNPDGSERAHGDTIFGMLHSSEGMSGDILYLRFCHRFVRTFVVPTSDIDPLDSVRDMGYSITFLAIWSKLVEESETANFKENFITRETQTDVLLTAMTVVVLVKVYREFYPKYPWVPRRLSSRFNEYIFSYLRLQLKGSPNFTALSARQHLRNLMAQIGGEAGTDVEFPQFKRGHKRGVGRTDFKAGWQLCWPSDEQINEALDAGMEDCKNHFREQFVDGHSLWGLLKDKAVDTFTLFNPKSERFWKEASDTQLEMASDADLGAEYLSKLCQGFHLPNDWRERFVSLSDRKKASKVSHSVTTNASVGGDSDAGGADDDASVGDGDGADSELAGCASLEEPCDRVCLPTGTLFRKSALVAVDNLGRHFCSCTTACDLLCENYLRGHSCTPSTCSFVSCAYRFDLECVDRPDLYVAECATAAKGDGLFFEQDCSEGTMLMKVSGCFRQRQPTGPSAHYTLKFSKNRMPEGSLRKSSFFVASGIGRNINTGCVPNAVFRIMRNGTGKEGVYVFSTRDAKAGDEVIAAYSLQQSVQCLCSTCVPIGQDVDAVVNVDEAESHDEDEDMAISKSNVAKFEKAMLKCVKVASKESYKPSSWVQDKRTPLFMAVQDVCRTLNSHVDKQAKDRKFRFHGQLCLEEGEVKDSTVASGTLSDGYISLDDDVAFLFEDTDKPAAGENRRHKLYYGNIAGLALQREDSHNRKGVTYRVNSLVRSKTVGRALMTWYKDDGVDTNGNRSLTLCELDAPEAMSTASIVCKVHLQAAESEVDGRRVFLLSKESIDDHADIVQNYDEGNIPLGAEAVKAARAKITAAKGPTLKQLREQCSKRGLKTSGKKEVLVDRLANKEVIPPTVKRKRRSGKENKPSGKRHKGQQHQTDGGFTWGASHLNSYRV